MHPERWRQIEELFHSIVELPPPQRTLHLWERCPDAEMRREIEQMLAADEGSGSAFEAAIGEAANAVGRRFGPAIPERLGSYRLAEELGAGGMGTVYLGVRDDEHFAKKVAIKILRDGLGSSAAVARFQQERQILATLDHPNIARLLDGGTTPNGLPYLILDYVEGDPLQVYCRDQRLPLTRRLELFRKICDAVAYAHQHLIVHRDLKPANILVTPDGTPKLLDFGIAKLLEDESGGRTTTMMYLAMTPEYASPEQVAGRRVTTATDVYSLGAILYELLTGRSAHELPTRSPVEMARVVCEEPVEKPSKMRRPGYERISADLDTIVLKAMALEPHDRYRSADQLSEDIGRFLAGRPVLARRASIFYRAGKFVRRHWLPVAAGAAVAIAFLAAGIVAQQQRRVAQARAEEMRQLTHRFLFDFYQTIANVPGAAEARSLVVKTALEYLEKAAPEARENVELRADLASAYERVAAMQGDPEGNSKVDPAAALSSYQKALALRLAVPLSTERRYAQLIQTHRNVARLLAFTGKKAEAEQEFLAALVPIQSHPDSLKQSPFMVLDASVGVFIDYGEFLAEQGRRQHAIELWQQCGRVIEEIFRRDPDPKWRKRKELQTRSEGAIALGLLAVEHAKSGAADQAVEEAAQSLSLARELSAKDPPNTFLRNRLMTAYLAEADVYLAPGPRRDPRRALAGLDRALEVAEGLVQSEPESETYRAARDEVLAKRRAALNRESEQAQARQSPGR